MRVPSTSRTTWASLLAVACVTGMLIGCASSVDPSKMTHASPPPLASFPAQFQDAICVRSVAGGQETGAGRSNVSSEDFRTALVNSLQIAGLLASADKCKLQLDANILGVPYPPPGQDMEVTSHVNYKLYDNSGRPILLETISASFTVKGAEAFGGRKRARMAKEGSVRTSIAQFLGKLQSATPLGARESSAK